ncbi:hypothetical protein [Streptomyces rimosus]|uniref:hypothetical protein n=1 Tax=Streptomyces rimosus TaxID=1927 RepID=UPI0004BED979|nr:hypothetical protein [Streptomyces rimosus]
MRPADICLSYTDPMTGQAPRSTRHRETRYADIDGVVLVVRHAHRSRSGLWSAEPYMDHLHGNAFATWAQHLKDGTGGGLIFAHLRRRDLLEQIAQAVGTEEWVRARDAWMGLPRDRWWSGRRFRVVRRAPRQWWALPTDPATDGERGPWPSKRVALDALGT